MSRSTTAYASATRRDRVHGLELFVGEICPIAADFNAILGAVPALSGATWQVDTTYSVVMSDATITDNASQVTLRAQAAGVANLRCTATLDSGAAYIQLFRIRVMARPYFVGDSVGSSGPQTLTATAVVDGGGSGGGGVLDGGGA